MSRIPPLTAGLLAAAVALGGARPARAQDDAAAVKSPGAILTYSQALNPDAIRMIQGKLRDAGVLQAAADGVWSSEDAAALRSFQQTRGLQVTGQINQATAVTLGLHPVDLVGAAGTATPAPPPVAATAPGGATPRPPIQLSSLAVRQVQIRLRENNFYNGPIDGEWGAGSQAALVRLQQSRGLPVTGRIDAASVQALGFDPQTFPPR